MRRTSGLALALCLVACAGTPQWTKQGITAQAAGADFADCRTQAQAITRRDDDIQADIMASRGHDWMQTNTLSTRQALYASENRRPAEDYVKSCMIAKGYAPGE